MARACQPDRQTIKLPSKILARRNLIKTEVNGGNPETVFSIPKKLLPQQM
jgi:hypothetical protein